MVRSFSSRCVHIMGSVALLCAFPMFSPKVFGATTTESQGKCICSPEQTSKAFTAVAKKAIPAVVFIKVESSAQEQDEFGNPYNNYQNPFDYFGDDFLNRFFGAPRGAQPAKPTPQLSQGSGFLVTADGYIMTNAHVVKGANKILVVLNDGREMDASLIGADPHTDIAVIKIEGKDFPFVTLGDSDKIEVGEWVVAIGSPFQLEASVTVGVVSARGRQDLRITDLEDFIQTDAAINPGNSGGPLFEVVNGQVVGINTAIVSRNGGYMGIGFAIPSNMAKTIMDQIIEKGVVTRGFLGVSLQPVDKDIADAFNLAKPEGALISEVLEDSPAKRAGLMEGDVIIAYNNIPVKSLQNFRKDISLMNPGSSVTLKVNRKGEILVITITLGTASDVLATGGMVQKLGMKVDILTSDTAKQLGYTIKEEGVVITKIKPGSPAAMAGLRPGYLIQAVNHRKVANLDDFNEAINQGDGKRILLLVRQGNLTRFYSIKVD